MRIGPLPDAMKLDIHGVGTHWNRGFMAFQLAWGRDTGHGNALRSHGHQE
jgi:hypothetical protein